MKLKDLRIGYVPNSLDLSQPGDRRRFPHFALNTNLAFEIADNNITYDIIILPAPANLSLWLGYKRKHPTTKFIFEMVDSLIFSTDYLYSIIKGPGKFILGKEKTLYFNYRKLVLQWVQIADIVLCSNNELKNGLLKYNKNVILSLDYMEKEYQIKKVDYEINGKIKLVWEGLGSVLPHFLHFKEVFKKINSFCELHVITSEKYSLYGKLFPRDVSRILDQLPIETIFHKWELNSNNKILSECDLGIIPLDKKNSFGWHKPANKLISFWFTKLPTLVSNTPAYMEMMNDADTDWHCNSEEEWIKKIKNIYEMSAEERKRMAEKNLEFVKKNYSDEALDTVWLKIFEKVTMKQNNFSKK